MRESLIAGQYLLIEQVGRGGFAVVWRARDDRLQRDVAAKQLFLPPHFTEEQRREHRERTLREARSAARLTHPGVVTVHDVVEHDGVPWIIMEFVHGRTLGQIVRKEGPLPPVQAARIGLRLLDALRAAHAAGVLHRDVKPSNVIIGDQRVVLGDFGIARIDGDDEITESGIVMGAPSYTAPERARGEPAVAASDLWSLGATLFYAVEGRRAFSGPNANATFHAILTSEPAPTRRAGPLAPVIEGLLRRDTARRMTASEAAELLADAANAYGSVPAPRRRGPERPGHSRQEGRRGRDGWREPTRPTSDVPGVPLPRPADDRRRRPAGRLRPGPSRAAGPRRHRPIMTIASLTTLVLVVLSNGLRVDDPRRRPAASYRTPVPRPRLAATLPAGRGELLSVAFSPDGRTIATAGQDHAVRLWDVAGRPRPATVAKLTSLVAGMAFSPDGRTLATAGDDRTVRLWDLHGHRPPAAVPRFRGRVNAVAFSPDSHTLACASEEDVLLWNTTTGTPAARFDARTRTVEAIAFSPDGKTLATAGDDAAVRLWDLT